MSYWRMVKRTGFLLVLLVTACDAADQLSSSEEQHIYLSDLVVNEKIVPGVGANGAVQPARLVFARLDVPDWLRYFSPPDGAGRVSPAATSQREAHYTVNWTVSVSGSVENILVNSVAAGKFIATSPEGRTLGANRLPTGAYAFFVADAGVAGGNYVIRATLSDGAEPPKNLGQWSQEFILADAFSFPSFFRFQVRGIVIDSAQQGADKGVYPAPVTGVYTAKPSTDVDGVAVPHTAEATVFLTSAATSSKRDVFYYDFVSLTKGYTIEYLSSGVDKVEPEVKADPKKPNVKATPKILVTQIVHRSAVDTKADHLPAAEEEYAVRFRAEPGTAASGKVVLWVRDQQRQRGTLVVYLRALKQ